MVSLREITPENWLEVIRLKVHEDQKEFVAPNVFSLAQAKVFPALHPLAIYEEEALVGFAMYGIDADDGAMWISRLMVDREHQGKGYARAAMALLLARIREETPGGAPVYLSLEPENRRAESLYLTLGFSHTGREEEGERVMRLFP